MSCLTCRLTLPLGSKKYALGRWLLAQLPRKRAGVIHTDFERGFIRAEVISYEDFIEYNGEKGAAAAGKSRLEGKTYIVQDGDVMHFRFNV